jgi:hypothetical protein
MITEKLYKVQLLDGKETTTLYETRQEAVRAHRGNIAKLIEVLPKHTKPKVVAPTNDQLAIVISKRSNEDLDISKNCGYAVMYNCPKMDKIYDGMKYLEVSNDYVLEATITKLEKYEKSIHHHWKGPGYKPDKVWKWALFHKNGKIVPRKNVEERYSNPLKGTQGGISYIKI